MERISPFKICGNIYFVGTKPASSHVIATEEGLILLDSGMPDSLPHVIESIWELGFDVRDIRIILHSHGHIDHLGATRQLLELVPAAETYLGEADADYANGTLDLTWARELGYTYAPHRFQPTHLLKDNDVIRLGSTEILCLSAPGHTPGTMAFFFNTVENGVTYRAAMHGGVGINSMSAAFLRKYGLPFALRDAFLAGLEQLKEQPVDVPLGNHVAMNDTLGKAARIGKTPDNPFIAPNEWIPFLDGYRQRLLDQMSHEKEAENHE